VTTVETATQIRPFHRVFTEGQIDAIDPEKVRDRFAADLPAEETTVLATQRPVAEAASSERTR
jgi:hypothetical protein